MEVTVRGEISYDLVMTDDMSFVEGTFRLEGSEWQVFIFRRKASLEHPQVTICKWDSGVEGIVFRLPKSVHLNKQTVELMMSEALKVSEWHEIRGSDSMQLR
jgi:hypothetical protein